LALSQLVCGWLGRLTSSLASCLRVLIQPRIKMKKPGTKNKNYDKQINKILKLMCEIAHDQYCECADDGWLAEPYDFNTISEHYYHEVKRIFEK
jgi:hypothetical protein